MLSWRFMKLLVTGGAGFIGSAFIRLVLESRGDIEIVNLDKLTYAGNLENLASVESHRRYRFVHGDICDAGLVERCSRRGAPDAIVHFAAESHVDRSIFAPQPVFETNLRGTFTLLEAARAHKIARVSSCLYRRGIRQPGAAARSRRDFSAAAQQPLFGVARLAPT